MHWLVLLTVLLSPHLYAADFYEDVSEGTVKWGSYTLDSDEKQEGIARLTYYTSSDRNGNDSFAININHAGTTTYISASLSSAMRSGKTFTIFNHQEQEIGTGSCVFREDFADYWHAFEEWWYPDGGTVCTLKITDDKLGDIELTKGFDGLSIQFVQGSITQGNHRLSWWHDVDAFWPLAHVGETSTYVGTSSWQNSDDSLYLTYEEKTLYQYYDPIEEFTLTLSDVTGTQQHHIKAQWDEDITVRDALTESRIGKAKCRHIENQRVCELIFSIEGYKQIKLTKTFDPWWKLSSIAGTISWEGYSYSWQTASMMKTN